MIEYVDGLAACWWCGAEPEDEVEVHTLAGRVRTIYHWPRGNHTHSVEPPTADELLDQVLLRPVGGTP